MRKLIADWPAPVPVEHLSPLFPNGLFRSDDRRSKGKPIKPAPVYIGISADGRVTRHSFWTAIGAPLDYERGRRIAQASRLTGPINWRMEDGILRGRPTLAVALVNGFVEHEGEWFLDPAFGGKAPAVAPAKRKAPVEGGTSTLVWRLTVTLRDVIQADGAGQIIAARGAARQLLAELGEVANG